MNDMSSVIVPKSDQLNSDDLIAGPRTIRIREVTIRTGTEQPVSIFFDGDNGKPLKPCKSTSRVLVAAWGADANVYRGRSLTIYRDDSVTWGGMKVGGIRISHMSDLERPLVIALTEKKGSKKIATIVPLKVEASPIDAARQAIADAPDMVSLGIVWKSKAMAPFRADLQAELDARKLALTDLKEGPDDSQRGEAHSDDTAALIASFTNANDDDAYNAAKKALDVMRGSLSADDLSAVEMAREDAADRVLG